MKEHDGRISPPYTGRLKKLRKYVKEIDGVAYVHKNRVHKILKPKELALLYERNLFVKVYQYHTCECGYKHPNLKDFKTYIMWWTLEAFINSIDRYDK